MRGGASVRKPSGRLPFARLGDGRRVGRRVHRARRRRRRQRESDIHDDAACEWRARCAPCARAATRAARADSKDSGIAHTSRTHTIRPLRARLTQWHNARPLSVCAPAVFVRGSNMIPLDQLEGRTTDAAYVATVASAAAAGMNMLRVWGGGLYFPDAFYDACDRHGVMVYHVCLRRESNQCRSVLHALQSA